MELETMSIEELEQLKIQIENLIQSKRSSQTEQLQEFKFSFDATNDPRKGIPYVARLYWADGKVQREFKDLYQTKGKGNINVSGEYTARVGEIIEQRTGGSWKNDYRYWYYIDDAGNKIHVADIDNAFQKARVIKYLQGKLMAAELLKV